MIRKRKFPANNNNIREMTDFVKENLESYGIKKRDCYKAIHAVEEVAESLINHKKSTDNADANQLYIIIKAFFGSVRIELSTEGEKYSLANNIESTQIDMEEGPVANIQDTLRHKILDSMTDSIKYHHYDGVNYVQMLVIKSRQALLIGTIGGMILAIICGFIFAAFLSDDSITFLNSTFLTPVKTMYMNALKMIVCPVVFFSIISSIMQFSDLSALGRIGGKIIGLYLFTTVVAIAIGIGMFFIFQPGDASFAKEMVADASAITSQKMNVSIKDTIVGIIPSDIISPFLKANMLQLIFMAVIMGIATGLLGKYSKTLSDLFNACNDLFLKVTSLIIKAMPVAVFCSILSMMLTMGIKSILSVLGMFGTYILGIFATMCFYILLMVILGRMNPIPFIKKYSPFMLQVFSLASSNAAIPVNMEACEKKIGISKKIFSLSIPLGATINMDGTCVYLTVFALALAKAYGVNITGVAMLSMIISTFVLSIGAPGIPGSGLICLSVLLAGMNVPVEAVGLVMGIDSICGMFRCMNNSLGDVVASTIVAKSENELDMNIYNSR
ncbi:MAG: dicarboxylate/amino acid:cation symporter [Lachnospiraceae bacterium]|nr:dicarboxylate/amino acid:cation symporter [Lachnospiraceae bacterium]